ncbi:hypothetical protein [Amycolatopsis sp. NPDC059021]|uniref:hypothetical protein n=1 Tax=Amycolatopsis sp. NPDC059021 TaxID=3346704 RepID=UPI0036729F83
MSGSCVDSYEIRMAVSYPRRGMAAPADRLRAEHFGALAAILRRIVRLRRPAAKPPAPRARTVCAGNRFARGDGERRGGVSLFDHRPAAEDQAKPNLAARAATAEPQTS